MPLCYRLIVYNFSLFIKFRQYQYFRHDGQFSSFRQFFVKANWSLMMIFHTLLQT